jgi:hypothetical protein
MTQYIIPEKAPPDQQVERPYWAERREYEKAQNKFKIENVRFEHNPHWRDNVFSMQYMGDAGRTLIKGSMQPIAIPVGFVEDLIFWTWFDLLNKQDKSYRAKSLPPLVSRGAYAS